MLRRACSSVGSCSGDSSVLGIGRGSRVTLGTFRWFGAHARTAELWARGAALRSGWRAARRSRRRYSSLGGDLFYWANPKSLSLWYGWTRGTMGAGASGTLPSRALPVARTATALGSGRRLAPSNNPHTCSKCREPALEIRSPVKIYIITWTSVAGAGRPTPTTYAPRYD